MSRILRPVALAFLASALTTSLPPGGSSRADEKQAAALIRPDRALVDEAHRLLVGTWIGSFQQDLRRRELLIRWVTQRNGILELESFYGYENTSLDRINDMTVTVDRGSVSLAFTTPAVSKLTLTMTGERAMGGTFVLNSGERRDISFALRSHTPWPPAQIKRGPSHPDGRRFTGELASFKNEVVITPPGPEIPGDLARYSGLWVGWCSVPTPRSVRVAVERITPAGADITVADGGSGVALFPKLSMPGTFVYVDNELFGSLPRDQGTWKVSLRLRVDGNMDYMLLYRARLQYCAGVLAKAG